MRSFLFSALLLGTFFGIGLASCDRAFGADIAWDAGGSDKSWGTADNWAGNVVPLTSDSVTFTDTGAGNLPGIATNIVDVSRAIAGLTYASTNGHFQTTDLGGFTLQVNGPVNINTNVVDTGLTTIQNGTLNLGSVGNAIDLSVGRVTLNTNNQSFATLDLTGATVTGNVQNLIVGEKILGGSGFATGALALGSGGALTVGSAASPGQIRIGHVANSGGASGTVDLSQQATFTANVGNLLVGTGEVGAAAGTLSLAASNTINAGTVRVGFSTQTDSQTTSILHLGDANSIAASEFTIGGRLSNGLLDIPVGGALTLGNAAQPTNLTVGETDAATSTSFQGRMNVANSSFDATLSTLSVGVKTGGGVGNFNGNETGTLVGGNAGNVVIGSAASPGSIIVGQVAGLGNATGTVDFSGQASLTANIGNFLIGNAAVGTANGTVSLAAANTITANTIRVGYSTATDNSATSILHLGNTNSIVAGELTVGGRLSNGMLDISAGGALTLGTASQPTNLIVGETDAGTSVNYQGQMKVSNAGFDTTLSALSVGVKTGGGSGNFNGNETGSLLGGNSGAITVGSVAAPGNIVVGQVAGLGNATGTVDFSGQTSFSANVGNFLVGNAAVGNASGIVSLPATSMINATTMRIGYSTQTDNQSATSALHLGNTSTIATSELTVGGRLSSGLLDVPTGASLTLGTAQQPTNLSIGISDASTGASGQGQMKLTGSTFNATLSSLSVGVKSGGGNGGETGTLLGGTAGNLSIGSPAAPGAIIVGQSSGGGTATGTADLSGQTSLTANLTQIVVGSSGNGSLLLPTTSTIDTKSIVIGDNGAGTLKLGLQSSILVDDVQIGNSYGNGGLQVRTGGSVSIGAPDRPANFSVGKVVINTNSTYGATAEFSGSTLNAYFNNFTVGTKDINLPGNELAKFVGGTSGTLNVGVPGNTANFIAGGGTTSTVDVSAMANFNANVNQMSLGAEGNATVLLAGTNTIDAKSLIVGSNGNATLNLGQNATVLADDLQAGINYGSGLIQMRTGGVLNLGSQARPTNLTLGFGITNTNSTYTGTLDLSNATVHAILGNVIIGQKDNLPGNQIGTLSISNHTDNTIVASSILLGSGPAGANGIINFGGGDFTANTIAKGTGGAAFNWAGGTLHVGTFGTPAIHFDLVNNGTGTLAPAGVGGSITGATAIFGNYTQQAAAAMQIDLGGHTAGTSYDQVTVSNTASLGGTFNVHLTGGFQPSLGDTFTPLTFASHVGDFSAYTGLNVGGHLTLVHSLTATSLLLTARPTQNGDINLDGVVNGLDIAAVASNWLTNHATGDVNGDGVVNGLDISVIASNWLAGGSGASSAAAVSATAVPEPSSVVLAALAGLTVIGVRGKRRPGVPSQQA